jgi:hypothetical protein
VHVINPFERNTAICLNDHWPLKFHCGDKGHNCPPRSSWASTPYKRCKFKHAQRESVALRGSRPKSRERLRMTGHRIDRVLGKAWLVTREYREIQSAHPSLKSRDRKLTAHHSSTTGFRSVPMPEISTSSTSPAFIHTGGLRRWPTPAGVPVAMTSPGARCVNPDTNAMIFGIE